MSSYNVYIKGVSEDTFAASAYAIYESSRLRREARKEMQPTPNQRRQQSLYNELYAVYSAICRIPEFSMVTIHTQDTTICSWLRTLQPAEYSPICDIWKKIMQELRLKKIMLSPPEWHKKGTCLLADRLRTKAFARLS